MYQVTELVPIGKSKYRVCLEGKESFVLYKRECNTFGIGTDVVVSAERYAEIVAHLKKRALKYAVYILEASDRTEGQIKDKLHNAGYPEEAADYAVEKLCGYHYIDDRNYAEHFVERNCNTMSVREMENKLYGKKVPEEIIREVIDSYKSDNYDADKEAFLYHFNKKHIEPDTLDSKEKQRLAAYFLRKGFSYDLIKKYLNMDDLQNYY